MLGVDPGDHLDVFLEAGAPQFLCQQLIDLENPRAVGHFDLDAHGTVDLRQSLFAGPGKTGRAVMPASLVVGEDCSAPTRGSVALCAASCSDLVWTDRDIRWLGPTGFNDRARQVQIVRPSRGVHSVALYCGADFGGTCQTITEQITYLTLPRSTIGADQVS